MFKCVWILRGGTRFRVRPLFLQICEILYNNYDLALALSLI